MAWPIHNPGLAKDWHNFKLFLTFAFIVNWDSGILPFRKKLHINKMLIALGWASLEMLIFAKEKVQIIWEWKLKLFPHINFIIHTMLVGMKLFGVALSHHSLSFS